MPDWLVLVKDLGFPITLAAVLLYYGFRYVDRDRVERSLERDRFLEALSHNTAAIEALASDIRLLVNKRGR